MPKMIIRNDDVGADTPMEDLRRFCDICDTRGFKILQGIVIEGDILNMDNIVTNEQIKVMGNGRQIFDNAELIDFLKQRDDLIAVHGFWHTHVPTREEIEKSKRLLIDAGLTPTYFIPPFNEGEYGQYICGLKVSTKDAQNIEHYFAAHVPTTPIAYTHFWRYSKWYTWKDLETVLDRIKATQDEL
jgi:hypothetical protein